MGNIATKAFGDVSRLSNRKTLDIFSRGNIDMGNAFLDAVVGGKNGETIAVCVEQFAPSRRLTRKNKSKRSLA